MGQLLVRSAGLAGAVGICIGVLSVVILSETDRLTSTDSFCANSCHAMSAHVDADPYYRSSTHRTAYTGIQAGCGDCHLPPGLLAATWEHIRAGTRDIYSSMTNDFTEPGVWQAKRHQLAYNVRDWLVANDSAPCRKCHEDEAIVPRRARGERQHELAQRQGVTCIGCHFNLVHEPVPLRDSFIARMRVYPDYTTSTH